MTTDRGERAREAAEGIAQLEGYLLYQSEVSGARAEAEDFAGHLPWLTAEQRAEVVRLYTVRRLALTRRVLQGVVDRALELRREYAQRYALLRRRLWCACVALLLAAASLVTAVLLTAAGMR